MNEKELPCGNEVGAERERIAAEYRKLAFGEADREIKCSEKLKALAEYSRVLSQSEGSGENDSLSVIVVYDYE